MTATTWATGGVVDASRPRTWLTSWVVRFRTSVQTVTSIRSTLPTTPRAYAPPDRGCPHDGHRPRSPTSPWRVVGRCARAPRWSPTCSALARRGLPRFRAVEQWADGPACLGRTGCGRPHLPALTATTRLPRAWTRARRADRAAARARRPRREPPRPRVLKNPHLWHRLPSWRRCCLGRVVRSGGTVCHGRVAAPVVGPVAGAARPRPPPAAGPPTVLGLRPGVGGVDPGPTAHVPRRRRGRPGRVRRSCRTRRTPSPPTVPTSSWEVARRTRRRRTPPARSNGRWGCVTPLARRALDPARSRVAAPAHRGRAAAPLTDDLSQPTGRRPAPARR